jgi:hypothetical protein
MPVAIAVSRSLSSAWANRPDRDVAGWGIPPEAAHHCPTVIDRHSGVNQDDVRALGRGSLVTLLAIIGQNNLKIIGAGAF